MNSSLRFLLLTALVSLPGQLSAQTFSVGGGGGGGGGSADGGGGGGGGISGGGGGYGGEANAGAGSLPGVRAGNSAVKGGGGGDGSGSLTTPGSYGPGIGGAGAFGGGGGGAATFNQTVTEGVAPPSVDYAFNGFGYGGFTQQTPGATSLGGDGGRGGNGASLAGVLSTAAGWESLSVGGGGGGGGGSGLLRVAGDGGDGGAGHLQINSGGGLAISDLLLVGGGGGGGGGGILLLTTAKAGGDGGAGGSGAMTVSGSGYVSVANQLIVGGNGGQAGSAQGGNGGTGTLTLNGSGTTSVADSLFVGGFGGQGSHASGGQGGAAQLLVSGGATLNTNFLIVGGRGGSFFQNLGAGGAGGAGMLSIQNGTLNTTGNIRVGGVQGLTYNMDGQVVPTSPFLIDPSGAAGSGTLNFGSGALSVNGGNGNIEITRDGVMNIGWNGSDATAAGSFSAQGIAINNGGRLHLMQPGTFFLNSALSGNGWLEQSGTGTTVLSRKGTFSGTTHISRGTLQLTNSGAVAGSIENHGTLVLKAPDASTFSNNTHGSGSLVIEAGEGNFGGLGLVIEGANSHTGGTTLVKGQLVIGFLNPGSLDGDIANNGNLTYRNVQHPKITGTISGSGTVKKSAGSGDSTLIFTANNTYTGRTTIESGTLQLGDAGTTGSVAGPITNNAALVFKRSDSPFYSQAIDGRGSVIQAGSGGISLNGVNTYSGGTILKSGVLGIAIESRFTASGALRDSAIGTGRLTIEGGEIRASGAPRTLANPVTLAGDFRLGRLTDFTGAVTLTRDVTITSTNPDRWEDPSRSAFTGSISGEYALAFAEGANPIGAIVLSGTNTHSGGTTLRGGALITTHPSALGTGDVTLGGGRLQIGEETPAAAGLLSASLLSAEPGLALGEGASLVSLADTGSILTFTSTAPDAILFSGGGGYDFSLGSLSLDLNDLFSLPGDYPLLTGGTGNVDAPGYAFLNPSDGLAYAFQNGTLSVTPVPEPSAGALAAAALFAGFLRRRGPAHTPE